MTDILQDIENLRKENPQLRVSFVSGLFRIIHVGHIRLLRFAKEMSDILVVGIMPDPDPSVTHDEYQERLEAIESVIFVDFVQSTPDLISFLHKLQPDFVVKGTEHENKHNLEQDILEQYGGILLFTAGATSLSLSDRVKNTPHPALHLLHPNDYYERHNIQSTALKKIVEAYGKLQVVVVGDIIVDEYISCDPLGMSQEDPTIVVTPIQSDKYLGGSGIVAAHAASLGARVQYFSVCGADDAADFAKTKLTTYGVAHTLFEDKTRPTTLKQRFKCRNKTMLRVSHLRQHAINHELAVIMLERIEKALSDSDLLIFSDFNYGCLPQFFVERVIRKAIAHGVPIVADSQSSSQVGDVSRFTDTMLLTPTEHEARLATKDFESGLVVLANKLMEKAKAKHIVITLAEAGLLVHSSMTDQLPALNPLAVDTAGAGDSFLVATSLALATGATIWEAAGLGSLAAALQVSREGNIPLSKDMVLEHLCCQK